MQAIKKLFISEPPEKADSSDDESHHDGGAANEDTASNCEVAATAAPPRLLSTARAVDLANEPESMGFFTLLPKGADPSGGVTGSSRPASSSRPPSRFLPKMQTPVRRHHPRIMKEAIEEDGTLWGTAFGYSDSVLRGHCRRPPRPVDQFDFDAVRKGIPVPGQEDSPPPKEEFKLERILSCDNRESPEKMPDPTLDVENPEDDWYLHIDPEVYEQCVTVFTHDFMEENKKREQKEKEAATKRRRFNEIEEEKPDA